MSDKISVIVPIYNGEKYLVRCLDSFKRQTWQDIEFLLIDDGSKDGSAAICQQYVESDSRFQFRHKENGGIATARNLGLSMATGDYLCFCDCDDWVDDNYYELLLNALMQTGADMIVCGYSEEFSGTSKVVSKAGENQILSREEAMVKMALAQVSCGAWNKMFTASKYKTLLYNPDVRVGEDYLHSSLALLLADKVAYCPDIVYHYAVNGDSLTHVVFHDKMWNSITANLLAMEKSGDMPNTVKNAQRTNLIRTVCYLLERACTDHVLSKERYRSCKKLLRENNVKPAVQRLTFGEKCRFYTFKSGRVFLNIYCRICPVLYRIYRSRKRKKDNT